MLSSPRWFATKGHHPRNFSLHPSGSWVVVLNADSDNCVVFALDRATCVRMYRIMRPISNSSVEQSVSLTNLTVAMMSCVCCAQWGANTGGRDRVDTGTNGHQVGSRRRSRPPWPRRSTLSYVASCRRQCGLACQCHCQCQCHCALIGLRCPIVVLQNNELFHSVSSNAMRF